MKLEDCFEIGFILKPHGLKGAVNIHLDVDDPEKYGKLESVIVRKGNELIPFLVSSLHINGNKGILHFEDVHSVEEAMQLKSATLMLPLSLLPKLNNDQFYYHDVIGYTICDRSLGKLGTIEQIFTGGNQDLISMKYKDKEVLIPVSNEIVGSADHEKNEVNVNLPDGLLDIYL
ncbi:MAG: ribosome maturation factor RimM [Cytophagales bacterium]|nr:ribosome maturation factor RimM [Cytophagales bacterium]